MSPLTFDIFSSIIAISVLPLSDLNHQKVAIGTQKSYKNLNLPLLSIN